MLLRPSKKRIRPQLTLRIFLWGLVNVSGLAAFSTGLVYLMHGPGLLFRSFPGSTVEGLASMLFGGGIMIYAAGNILREMMKQPSLLDEDGTID